MADVQEKSETAKREEAILAFWQKEKIFEQSLTKPSAKGEFVFYDGPPFATGLPHHGHLLGSTSKDLFGRYKTMRGYHVRRRWGWDCHGLPIESKVEQKLGIKNKKELAAFGIEKFNETARSLVLEYVGEWKRYIERLGRWVDFDNSYKTMDASFTESVWWALKQIHTKGKLYEGKKVLMYCPKDETPLAKAEIAMDNTYKDVTEEAVTVQFKVKDPEKHDLPPNTYLLAWTTTPWTLPGNVALAVGPTVQYVLVQEGDAYLLVAKALASKALFRESSGLPSVSGQTFEKELSSASLIGVQYEPLYSVPKVERHSGKKHTVVAADFVTTEEGTGIVHTAVMYGEDDFALGQKEELPMVQLLESNGTFNADAPAPLVGQYFKKAEKWIKEDLASRGLLFATQSHTHSYPHCHRCGTPLIYNAVNSWFIDVQSIKGAMLEENKKVTWVPGHLKEGRFKHIVEGAPDWTISRNRFWASPLPIWKDAAGGVHVVGSLAELRQRTKKSGNTYFIMRHGQAKSNVERFIAAEPQGDNTLTEVGREQSRKTAEGLKGAHIDLIITSPYVRTVQTAEVVADTLGYSKDAIVKDPRIQEFDFGHLNHQPVAKLWEYWPTYDVMFRKSAEDGETLADMRKRLGEFIYDLEARYQGKNIVIVTHEYGTWLLESIARGLDQAATIAAKLATKDDYFQNAEVRKLDFVPLPHNRDFELDYHLPYIDDVELVDEQGAPLRRVPEVVDSWVEAGAMPFAEYHYPFEHKAEFEKRTPADFISEYIAQTRTWFYYLHTLGILLFNHRAFKNVVTTGTILAADGEKMSKSKNNFTDPYALFDMFGVDALRYYLMSSVVMQAEDFNFKDEDLRDVHNKVVNILRNTLTFYALYRDDAPPASRSGSHVLDRWIIARLDTLVREVTDAMDHYDTVRATRPMRDFIEDFSTWYVRRSRDRVKGEESAAALSTMRYVLHQLSKLIAPVMPFIADEIYRTVRAEGDPESVHLAEWPSAAKGFLGLLPQKPDHALIADMAEVRQVVSQALKLRQAANIKVRQPLASLKVKSVKLEGKAELLGLVKDELNVKEVVFDKNLAEDMVLDTTINPELKEEGDVRELMRAIQDLRKEANLAPKDRAVLTYAGDAALLTKHWEQIARATNLERFVSGDVTHVEKL